MLLNDTTYRMFRPDLENPTQEDMAPISQMMNALPVPWVEAEDIANAVLFLVSDEARYITGVPLPVDAGSMLK
jgi:NAD(P)-dependent dehydrogenase (short-subunit alcohol dehydrogenase family)